MFGLGQSMAFQLRCNLCSHSMESQPWLILAKDHTLTFATLLSEHSF